MTLHNISGIAEAITYKLQSDSIENIANNMTVQIEVNEDSINT